MRITLSGSRTLAVALLFGSTTLAACGAEQGGASALDRHHSASLHALVSDLPGSDDDEGEESADDSDSDACDAIRSKLQKDALAMQKTPEFRALAKTKEFKQMQKTVQAMEDANCSLTGNSDLQSPECLKLKLQAYRDQQALMRTPEFKKLQKTPQFKAVMKDAQQAQQQGCLDGMGSDANAALMVIL